MIYENCDDTIIIINPQSQNLKPVNILSKSVIKIIQKPSTGAGGGGWEHKKVLETIERM